MVQQREPQVEVSEGGGGVIARLSGPWTTHHAARLDALIDKTFATGTNRRIEFDLSNVSALDTVGAWLLARRRSTDETGRDVVIAGASAAHEALFEHVNAVEPHQPVRRQRLPLLLRPFDRLGRMTVSALGDVVSIHAVLGRTLAAVGSTLALRAPFRLAAVVNQFDLIALRAVPIVMLISIVVGAIITQQSILQLNNFGVAIYVVDLAAILMLREVGLLLAAIMVAGRSGSAITAELGSMRMREELDALSVIGVDPYQVLILPRVIALLIGLPFLAFIGALSGLVGAAIVALIYGGIPIDIFLDRLQDALNVRTLMVGLIKAPVMALIIGLVAVNEGFKVAGSSESLGRHTTASVVRAIFLVIVADGLFAMFFAAIGV